MQEIKLNKSQEEAVKYCNSPLLIIAGAGTGKTRVISEKIKYLIEEKKIKPNKILALTYTEKAANEMEERVCEFLNKHIEPPKIATFHGFCYQVLQDEAISIGLSSDFKLLTKPEQLLLLYENFNKLNLNYYKPLANPTSCLNDFLNLFANLKSENITIEEYEKLVVSKKENKNVGTEDISSQDKKAKELTEEKMQKLKEEAYAYKTYNQILRENNALDYGDIIMFVYKLFSERKNVLDAYQRKYKYILVDEYQDTNIVQNDIINLLSAKHKKICVVGDDDQSIFRFQGASFSNILNFEKDYSDVKRIVLNENYRSGQNILDASYELIQANNPDRLEIKNNISKKLKSNIKNSGNIHKVTCESWEDELDYILQEIKKSIKSGKNLDDIAVLYRSHSIGANLIPILKNNNIPFKVVAGPGLYEQEEIRTIRNIIKFITNPDDSLSLFHILTLKHFEIDPLLIVRLSNQASKNKISLFNSVNNYLSEISGKKTTNETDNLSLFSAGLTLNDQEKLSILIQKLRELIKFQVQNSASQVVYEILFGEFKFISLIEETYKDDEIEKDQKIANLSKFYRRVEKFEYTSNDRTIQNFNNMLDIFIEAGEDPDQEVIVTDYDAVNLLTIHKAKGLEFDTVFLMGLASRKFPSSNRKNKIEIPEELLHSDLPDGDFHKQEERRLMYVAMTRAKKNLHLTFSKKNPGGKREIKPSIFFDEVNDNLAKNIIYEIKDKNKIQNYFTIQSDNIDISIRPDLKISSLNNFISLSYSNISSYKRCPLQFKYQKIYRIPSEPKPALQFGQYIHRVLEYLHRLINQGQILSLEQILDYYNQNWNLKTVGFINLEHKETYKKEGAKIIEKYYKDNKDSFGKSMYLEKHFNFHVKDYKINGVIDRIDQLQNDDECEVIDYKTGKSKTEKDLKKDKLNFLQLYIYAIACQDFLNRNATKLTFYYLTDGSKITITPTPEDLSNAQDMIEEVANCIKENKFDPTPNDFICRTCEYNKICPARIKKV